MAWIPVSTTVISITQPESGGPAEVGACPTVVAVPPSAADGLADPCRLTLGSCAR
jgi:hypothetical protein